MSPHRGSKACWFQGLLTEACYPLSLIYHSEQHPQGSSSNVST